MQAPLKPDPRVQGQPAAPNEQDLLAEVPDDSLAAGGSAFVAPPSLGGAALVENARKAANKLRSLLG